MATSAAIAAASGPLGAAAVVASRPRRRFVDRARRGRGLRGHAARCGPLRTERAASRYRSVAVSRTAPQESTAASELASMLADAGSVVALTGAGISVPSGIPDFRTPGSGTWDKVDPMEVATIDAFRRDPRRFWSFYRPRFAALATSSRTPRIRLWSSSRRAGSSRRRDHQNVDRLHRQGGERARDRVPRLDRHVELHLPAARRGRSKRSSRCSTTTMSRYCPDVRRHVKPDVVLFGDMLPEAAMAEAQALAERRRRPALRRLVARGLSCRRPAAAHARVGGRLAIITRGRRRTTTTPRCGWTRTWSRTSPRCSPRSTPQ